MGIYGFWGVPGSFTFFAFEALGVNDTAHTDRDIGFAVLFGLLAMAGAVLVYVAPTQPMSAAGFAGAIGFGSLLIIALHYYS